MARRPAQNVEQADLVSYGIFGLIDAIEKFDPDRGFKFETYAIARIKGNILDELRSIDWVPRSVRAKARAIEKAFSRLEAELHRTPTDAELADALDITDDQLQQTLSRSPSSASSPSTPDGSAAAGDPPDRRRHPRHWRRRSTGRVRGRGDAPHPRRRHRAPARARATVVALYYYEGLTLAEIGEVLGVTESRVCQIHTKAVLQLRLRMTAAGREPA